MTPTPAEYLLERAQSLGAEAEVFALRSETVPVRFEDNELKMLESSAQQGFALRLLHEGRVGFTASTRPGSEEEVFSSALRLAKYGEPVEYVLPESADYPAVDIHDPRVLTIRAEDMVETGHQMMEAVRTEHPDVQMKVSLTRAHGDIALANTRGLTRERSSTAYGVSLQATRVGEDESLLHTGDYWGSTHWADPRSTLIENVLRQLRWGARRARITDGKYPVIFSPLALSDLLRPLLACVNGDAVARGISPWRNKLGDQLLHPSVTLVDDGLLPRAMGSTPWDDEGIPSQRTPLIEGGILKHFLLDVKTAARLHQVSTGNGFRPGLSSLPSISSRNLVVTPGDRSLDTLMQDIEEGLLIHSLMGAWGSNPYGGQISGNVALGYRIERGEVTGRVKDCMIYLNAFEAWNNQLIGISQEVEQRHSECFPYVVMDHISVASKDGNSG